MASEIRERIILTHKSRATHDFTIELFLDYGKEEGDWVGVCEQLGIAANADTLDEAKEILKDLVLLQLKGVEEISDINSFLTENGIAIMEPERLKDDESGFTLTTASSGA